jgi:hypothetical protein
MCGVMSSGSDAVQLVFHTSSYRATQCKQTNIRLLKVEVTLRLTVSWPVDLGVRPPTRTRDKIPFLHDNFF